MYKTWTEEKVKELLRLYHEGLSVPELSKHLQKSKTAIYYQLSKSGVKQRNPEEAMSLILNKRYPPATELRRLYYGEKLLISEIGKRLGVSVEAVRRLFKRLNISTRSHAEVRKIQKERGLLPPKPRGINHPWWRGGRIKNSYGYIEVRLPEHPRAHKGYVREHLLTWEKEHGQSLPEGWIIHHINGIKDDNRPENLLALPNKKHDSLLREYQKRIRILEKQVTEYKRQLNLL